MESGSLQKRKRGSYRNCSYGVCTSNSHRLNPDEGIKFIPFSKPCTDYKDEQIAIILGKLSKPQHNIRKCDKCNRARRWLLACKRKDSNLQKLTDITRHLYICSKHFANGIGPTAENPDPLDEAKIKKLKKKRKPSKCRGPVPTKCARQLDHSIDNNSLKDGEKLEQCADVVPCSSSDHQVLASEINELSPTDVLPFDAGAVNVATQTCNDNLEEIGFVGEIEIPRQKSCVDSVTESKVASITKVQHVQVQTSQVPCNWAVLHGEKSERFFLVGKQSFSMELEYEDGKCKLFVLGKERNLFIGKTTASKMSISAVHSTLEKLSKKKLCCGISSANLIAAFHKLTTTKMGEFCAATQTVRSTSCRLFARGKCCSKCMEYSHTLTKAVSRTKKKTSLFTNNKYLSKEEIVNKLQIERRKSEAQAKRLKHLQRKVTKLINNGHSLGSNMSKNFKAILSSNNNEDPSSLQAIVVQEQVKLWNRRSRGHRWDPLLIKWCSFLQSKSPAAYNIIRESGFLRLPSQRTLFNYGKQETSKEELSNNVLDETSPPLNN